MHQTFMKHICLPKVAHLLLPVSSDFTHLQSSLLYTTILIPGYSSFGVEVPALRPMEALHPCVLYPVKKFPLRKLGPRLSS